MKIYTFLALALFAFGPLTGNAQVVVASDDFDNPFNRVSLDITVDMAFMNLGDIFGVTNANTDPPDNTPFAVVDDGDPACPTFFANDNQGVIPCTYPNLFFAMSDTENPNNMGPVSADWVFDISGSSNLTSISIDMSAMGDFEASDNFTWSYSIDGSPFTTIFDMMPDESISADYNMLNGNTVTLNDPMQVNGTTLLNQLTTFTANINGSGSQLTLHLEGMGNGGSEAMAWDNIVISGFPAGAPIPTMSEWGLFLFALIMITFGVVFVFNAQHRLALIGPKGVSSSTNTSHQLPFHKETYSRSLITAFALTIAGFAVIFAVWGEIVTMDFIGMAITLPILAYLIHVVQLFGKKN